MAYSAVPLVATGDLWTAANQNTYLRDNMSSIWVGTTAGDTDYYTGAANKSRLAIGTAGQTLVVNAGATAPEWGAGGSFVLIEEILAGGVVASLDFTAIPATYTHLKIIFSTRGDFAGDHVTSRVRFNNDSGATYAHVNVSTVDAGNAVAGIGYLAQTSIRLGYGQAATAAAGAVGAGTIDIMNYAKTTLHKAMNSIMGSDDATANEMWQETVYGLWKSTVAINRVTLYPGANNFVAGSIASLYGIT